MTDREGLLNEKDNSYFVGWLDKNNQKWGYGIEFYNDGSRYSGYFLLDLKQFLGNFTFSDNRQYTG